MMHAADVDLITVPKAIHLLAIDDERGVLDSYQTLFSSEENALAERMRQLESAFSLEASDAKEELPFEIEFSQASSGEQGVEQVSAALESGNRVSVVLVDMRMPGGWDGVETAIRLKRVDPQIKVLFVSAYMDGTLDDLRDRFGAFFSYLEKPFNSGELLQLAINLGCDWYREQQLMESYSQSQQMQRALEESYHQIEEAQLFSSSLTQSMSDGVYALDRKGELIFMNQAAEEMLGWRYDEIAGRNFHELIHSCRPDGQITPSNECPVYKSMQQGVPYRVEKDWFQTKGRHFIPISFSSAPLVNAEGRPIGSVAVFHDISERLALEESLQRALKSEQQARQQRDQFFASISHELRTPLTVIIGNSEQLQLQQQSLEKSSCTMVDAISVSAKTQLALINDMLDLSKIEANRFQIDSAPYDLGQLLYEIEQIFSCRCENAGVEFSVVSGQLPAFQIKGDGRRVQQILINLLSNAVKFTQEGAVTLTITIDEQIHFKVKDSGIGMSQEAMDLLFQPYEQTSSDISSQYGGTGLGLYISHTLAKMMDGSISVESVEGEGSEFTLHLPYYLSDYPIVASKPMELNEPSIRLKGRVLVAEDSPEIRQVVERMLKSLGLEVVSANHGQEAVDQALATRFDLIIMDMLMPIMGGVEATKLLRATGVTTPIIALTANAMRQHQDDFIRAGADSYLTKPIVFTSLVNVLKGYLQEGEAVPEGYPFVDESLIALFEARIVEQHQQLVTALDAGQLTTLRDIAHSIKGTGGTFGYQALSQLAAAVCSSDDEVQLKRAAAALIHHIVQHHTVQH